MGKTLSELQSNKLRFQVDFLGCRLNRAEIEEVALELEKAGWLKDNNPQVVILNTCAVTQQAESKTRARIRQLKKRFPNCFLVVMGCWVQKIKKKPKANLANLVDMWIDNSEKDTLVSVLKKKFFKNSGKPRLNLSGRVFLKVQDGCDNFCSYCLTRFLRGKSRSRPVKKIVDQALRLEKNGAKEVVFTGVDIASYQPSISKLLKEVTQKTTLRVRLGSIDVNGIDDELVRLFCKDKGQKLCRHLHVSLQSGSERILRRMRRNYDLKDFKKTLKKIRKISSINLTTDIIVGFPGENKEDFKATLKAVKTLGFSKVHVFPFSSRPGTLADQMIKTGKWQAVDKKTIKKRAKKARQLSKKLENKFKKSQINKKFKVLIEAKKNGFYQGLTDNYIRVEIGKEGLSLGQVAEVVLDKNILN